MRSWHRTILSRVILSRGILSRGILAGAILLAATVSSNVHAQGFLVGNRLIPESSIEHIGDIGVRAHTYLQILAGPDGLPGIGPDGGMGPAGGLSPAQLQQAYNLPSSGGSQIIAIVDAYHDPKALSDFNTFSAQFGLPLETSGNVTASTNKVFQIVYGNGVKPGTDLSGGGWELEESLDIEWAHAMAPNAKIILVESKDESFANLYAADDTATSYVDGNGWKVKEVSNSWGGSEFSGENIYDTHFTSNSVVYFVSAGDSGAPAEYPTASPYVVSAGGTTLNTDNNGNFTSETAWSQSNGGGGGGGPSAYEPIPAFQNSISGIVGAWRGTPDLSSVADPNTGASIYDSYPYYGITYGWVVVGGTSWSSPTLAAIANLAATAAGSFPAGSQALLTTIYSNLGTANFRDITSGNNGYPATVGWDFASGVGTCQGLAGLQSAGAVSLAITSLGPGSASAGGPTFTLTVNGTGFVNGSTVNWNGTALTTTYSSSLKVTASVPASDIASAGTASVTVSNPGGSTSNALTFTINNAKNPVPVLSSLSPAKIAVGHAAFIMYCVGSKFVANSQVTWTFGGTTTTLTATYVSAVKLKVTIPSSLLTKTGTATVKVTNPAPGGGTSGGKSFTISP